MKPPICAELSTPGINPTAKFKAMTNISDVIAVHCNIHHNFSFRNAYLSETYNVNNKFCMRLFHREMSSYKQPISKKHKI